jgi:hypothetical protein
MQSLIGPGGRAQPTMIKPPPPSRLGFMRDMMFAAKNCDLPPLDNSNIGRKVVMVTRSSFALGACVILASALPGAVLAQPAGVEPRADAVLRGMTAYLSGLQKFSVTTENTLEVVTTEGQKIQFTAPASMTVARPNKLVAQRRGDIVDQMMYYDGKTLTLYEPAAQYYATVPAPATLDAMLDAAYEQLDLVAPGADLIDTRAYERLMLDVQSGVYLGTAMVAGQRCHHLAYRATEVDWQLWVRDGAQPAPCRYVITSKTMPGAPQFAVQVLKWDTSPDVSAARFRFVAPKGAKAIEFLSR